VEKIRPEEELLLLTTFPGIAIFDISLDMTKEFGVIKCKNSQ
jgi:hypothetical protein